MRPAWRPVTTMAVSRHALWLILAAVAEAAWLAALGWLAFRS
jgi:hypothetical protein